MAESHIQAFLHTCTMNTICMGGHAKGKTFGVTSNGVDTSGGLLRGPQICLNGNDSEQLNHTRTTHRLADHNTAELRQAGKTHTHTTLSTFHRVTSSISTTTHCLRVILYLHRSGLLQQMS